uniref:RxLR effector candidate protein n=1 Tax=Hyaloperonospora arabidopsidis (strain Emoy2) TaxID=559515 RepID=M4B7S4_HYAAE
MKSNHFVRADHDDATAGSQRRHHGGNRVMRSRGSRIRHARGHTAPFLPAVRALGVQNHRANSGRPGVRHKSYEPPAHGMRFLHGRQADAQHAAAARQRRERPIDYIGGVIYLNLKVLMATQDRLGNMNLIDFVAHKSNFCRIFLAWAKDATVKQFEAFLTHF